MGLVEEFIENPKNYIWLNGEQKKQKRNVVTDRICPVCGKQFYVFYFEGWVYKRSGKVFCSYHCTMEYVKSNAVKSKCSNNGAVKKPINVELNAHMKELRLSRNFTQPKLAAELGIHPKTICHIETNMVNAGQRIIKLYSDYFGEEFNFEIR